jgi:hypothetical protein
LYQNYHTRNGWSYKSVKKRQIYAKGAESHKMEGVLTNLSWELLQMYQNFRPYWVAQLQLLQIIYKNFELFPYHMTRPWNSHWYNDPYYMICCIVLYAWHFFFSNSSTFVKLSRKVKCVCDTVYTKQYIKVNTGCPTRYRTRHFFYNSNTNEDIATKFEQGFVRCVRNEEECVCSAPHCCDKEQRSASQPGSVASGTLYNADGKNVVSYKCGFINMITGYPLRTVSPIYRTATLRYHPDVAFYIFFQQI